MEFKAITTQEELDKIIGERLNRDREARQKEITGKYGDLEELAKSKKTLEDQISTLNGQIGTLNSQIEGQKQKVADYDTKLAELTAAQAKVKEYETTATKQRIAHENGIPYELAGRLTGTTEEELKADAKLIAGFIQKREAPPLGSSEPAGTGSTNTTDAAMRQLLNSLKGE